MAFRGADIHALHRLIYFSWAVAGSADELPPMMQAILATSVARNAEAGVTGALLGCDRWFVQALEGDRLKVGEIYQSICRDRRHRTVTLVTAGPIETRAFADWSMCGQTLSPTDDAILETLETGRSFDPASLSPASALRLLELVTRLQGSPERTVYV